ncbi:sensor domain-containing diguanylate cyclase [Aliarcobacter cryaerophilus]|uniref:sensor domain-containing diguanylate cyclase n=2 Tax=Aliarcobacter cryaerophilus TaxID=28198 RepID=UPI0021B51487|nr:cache domain-containing protein [Aliarcobacter cryaerophilus]MCT7515878.1 cache domain-containing protein [Aliarcobacter cryaerophilus]
MKLSKFITKFIFITAFTSVTLAFLISIIFQYLNFKNDLNHYKKEFTEQKKKEVKNEVLMIYGLIEYKEELLRKTVEDRLKDRVNQAYELAMDIYETNKKTKTEDEIKYLIAQSLDNFKFKDHNNYFFINSNKGQGILFDNKITLDNYVDIWDLKDLNNQPIIQIQAKIAKEQKEGFTTNSFIKPDSNDGIQYSKISYIKLFEPFDWHIGTGEYIDGLTKKNQEEILNWLNVLKYENSSYMFLNKIDGNVLIYEGKKVEPKPHPSPEIFNRQLEISKNQNGDFFKYKYKKPNSNEEFEKISFIKKFDEYGWIIGCGVYLDEIEKELQRKEEIFKEHINEQIISILIIFLFILLAIYFISKYIGDFINININNLVKAFSKASLDNKKIDTEKLTYTEFVILANNLNETLENKNNLEKELQNLSITDELTQLYNRRFFNSKIEEEINRAKRENKHLCLIVLDIDFFKQYNDTYGHQKGDFVLQEISKVLKNRTNRASDFAFRIGGEEFAILVNLEKNKISEFAEAIKNDIENLKIEHSGNKVSKYVTTSIGVNFKQADELKNIDELFKVADDNLYEAKRSGRNCVVIK